MELTLKDIFQLAGFVFAAGGVWTQIKSLRNEVADLKTMLAKVQASLNEHDTRLAVIESHLPATSRGHKK